MAQTMSAATVLLCPEADQEAAVWAPHAALAYDGSASPIVKFRLRK